MERKIGEIFEYNGEWYQCVEGICNKECYFYNRSLHKTIADINGAGFGACNAAFRSDDKSVIFKKLEKLGDPFERNGYLYQEYKAHTYPLLMNGDAKIPTPNGFAVKIKQNKVDMKEKKIKISKEDAIYLLNELHYILDERLSGEGSDKVMNDIIQILDIDTEQPNLKSFNLEEAKAGKSVCTRDGRKARIICFDAKGDPCPIIALVEENGIESAYHYDKNGQNAYNKSKLDLMMVPEKKVGYVNLYHNSNDRYAGYLGNNVIYKDEEFARKMGKDCPNYIKTVKVEWEE